MVRRPRGRPSPGCAERDYLADVGHAADKLDQPFEPQAETGVGHGAVPPQIQVPVVILRIEPHLRKTAEQPVVAFFPLAAADDLADARHQDIHGGHGGVVVVDPHVEGLDGLGIIADDQRPLKDLLAEVALVFRLQIRAPGHGEIERCT